MLSPVILFVYNRPNHTKNVIEALANNYLAKDTDIYIFSDSYKGTHNFKNVKETRDYINHIKKLNYFSTVNIFEAPNNKGLAKSVIEGVNKIFNRYEKIIVLEDDLVTSVDFLRYMNDALNYYESNMNIWSISGYNLPIEIPKDYTHDIYLSYRANSWGWGMWKNRWEKTDWEITDYNSFQNDLTLRQSFNKGGRDLSRMLDDQMNGDIDSWAIRWCYSQWKNNMYTIYPVVSKVKNIGLDGTGTHSGKTNKFEIVLDESPEKTNFSNPELDKRIIKSFQNYYISREKFIISSIKRGSLKLINSIIK